jgi:hypothetical protein
MSFTRESSLSSLDWMFDKSSDNGITICDTVATRSSHLQHELDPFLQIESVTSLYHDRNNDLGI